MSAGYTRQSTADIQIGLPIHSADVNAEFNQLQAAFDATTGHTHDGTTGGGAPITINVPFIDARNTQFADNGHILRAGGNDFNVIQNAITYANSIGGGLIYLGPGGINVNKTGTMLRFAKGCGNITLMGDGHQATTIWSPQNPVTDVIQIGNSYEGVLNAGTSTAALSFTATMPQSIVGYYAYDITTPTAIPRGTTVSSVSNTTVNLSGVATGALNTDHIVFYDDPTVSLGNPIRTIRMIGLSFQVNGSQTLGAFIHAQDCYDLLIDDCDMFGAFNVGVHITAMAGRAYINKIENFSLNPYKGSGNIGNGIQLGYGNGSDQPANIYLDRIEGGSQFGHLLYAAATTSSTTNVKVAGDQRSSLAAGYVVIDNTVDGRIPGATTITSTSYDGVNTTINLSASASGVAVGDTILIYNTAATLLNASHIAVYGGSGITMRACSSILYNVGLYINTGTGLGGYDMKGIFVSDCVYDTNITAGIYIAGSALMDQFVFANCWMSSAVGLTQNSGYGCYINASGGNKQNFTFTNCQFLAAANSGFLCDGTGVFAVILHGCQATSNSNRGNTAVPGISINAASYCTVIGCYSGLGAGLGANNQNYGISIGTSANSEYCVIMGNVTKSSATGSIQNSSTGIYNQIIGNTGT